MIRSALFAAAIAAFALPALAADIHVPLNQARRVQLAGAAADVVIGNAAVADVTVVDSRNIFVMGKAPGVTNVVVLDALGRTVFEGAVVVGASAGSQVTLYRGGVSQTLACSPRCESAQPLAARAEAPPSPMAALAAMASQAPASAGSGAAAAATAAAAAPR